MWHGEGKEAKEGEGGGEGAWRGERGEGRVDGGTGGGGTGGGGGGAVSGCAAAAVSLAVMVVEPAMQQGEGGSSHEPLEQKGKPQPFPSADAAILTPFPPILNTVLSIQIQNTSCSCFTVARASASVIAPTHTTLSSTSL